MRAVAGLLLEAEVAPQVAATGQDYRALLESVLVTAHLFDLAVTPVGFRCVFEPDRKGWTNTNSPEQRARTAMKTHL